TGCRPWFTLVLHEVAGGTLGGVRPAGRERLLRLRLRPGARDGVAPPGAPNRAGGHARAVRVLPGSRSVHLLRRAVLRRTVAKPRAGLRILCRRARPYVAAGVPVAWR